MKALLRRGRGAGRAAWPLQVAIVLLAALLPVAARAAGQTTYRIDPARSSFVAHVAKTGLFSAFGHNHTIAIRGFAGQAVIDTDHKQPVSLDMSVKTDSLAVMDDVSDKDRAAIEHTMKTQVLETARYPEITFRSSKITAAPGANGVYNVQIAGSLTMHGVTRPQTISAQVSGNETEFHARGQFVVKQTDYGMKPVSVAGGTVKVKNEVLLTFDILAHAG